jgi:hypothetical protein
MENHMVLNSIIPKQFSNFRPIEPPFNSVNSDESGIVGLVPCSKLTGNNLLARHQSGAACWGIVSGDDTKWINQYDHSLSCYRRAYKLNQFDGSNESDPGNELHKYANLSIGGPNNGETSGEVTSSRSKSNVGMSVSYNDNELEISCSGSKCQPTYDQSDTINYGFGDSYAAYNQALSNASIHYPSINSMYCTNNQSAFQEKYDDQPNERMRSIYDSNVINSL